MIPARLSAPAPSWERTVDAVVVGSGVAGLTAALSATAGGRVLLVTKEGLADGCTRWAQGGIAAALGADDTTDEHGRDTLAAGAGLGADDAVCVLVGEGPRRVRDLLGRGAVFDMVAGRLALTREGGHRRDRVAHAGGDATGVEVVRALVAAVRANPAIEVLDHAFALDLLVADGRVVGLTVEASGAVGVVRARAVVLATGGVGQVFAATTNPSVATGDGLAMALRAGAVLADLEFVQFHPTVLWRPDGAGQQVLVTEAMRGEGARLVDAAGRPVMAGAHPAGDLAPRDVVARTMSLRLLASGADHLWLDATRLGGSTLLRRFPNVVAACRARGIDPVSEPIPVVPAAHFLCGGVWTDLFGRSSLDGLYACGEVACTGVHGANRLASNSLLEGLVFGHRVGRALAADSGRSRPAVPHPDSAGRPDEPPGRVLAADVRAELTAAMSRGAGVLRSDRSLSQVARTLVGLADRTGPGTPAGWAATNLHTVATAIVSAARRRTESRGCHWREDFPDPSPRWCGRQLHRLGPAGDLVTTFRPLATVAA